MRSETLQFCRPRLSSSCPYVVLWGGDTWWPLGGVLLLVFTAKVPKSDHTIQCFRTYSVLSWTHQLHKVKRRYIFFYVFKRCSNPKMLRGSATSPAWQLSSWTLHRCSRFWPQVLFRHAGEKAPAPSECCHRGGGHVRKRGQTEEFVSYLESNKKEKEKEKHLVRLH